jgi:hypothetical protein
MSTSLYCGCGPAPGRFIGARLGHFGLLAHAREKRTIPPVQTILEPRPEVSSRHHVID